MFIGRSPMSLLPEGLWGSTSGLLKYSKPQKVQKV